MVDNECYIAGITLECGVSELSIDLTENEAISVIFEDNDSINISFGLCNCDALPSGSLVLGESDSTAYRGDRGKIAYDHSQKTGTPHVTDAEKTKWNAAYDLAQNPPLKGGGILSETDPVFRAHPAYQITSTNIIKLNSLTKALGTELDTKTDDTKYATAKALSDSKYQLIHRGASAPLDTTMLWIPSDTTDLETMTFVCPDYTSDLAVGEKLAIVFPVDFTVTRVYASVATAPVGAALEIDIDNDGFTIFNSVLTIAVSTYSAETSAFTGGVNSYEVTKGDFFSVIIDQIGSSTAGSGLAVFVEGYRR